MAVSLDSVLSFNRAALHCHWRVLAAAAINTAHQRSAFDGSGLGGRLDRCEYFARPYLRTASITSCKVSNNLMPLGERSNPVAPAPPIQISMVCGITLRNSFK
jgi:hypothetical protein